MKTKHFFLILAFACTPLFVNAQTFTSEEKEVWEHVQKSYEVFFNWDFDGWADLMTDNYHAWNNEKPFCYSKEESLKNQKKLSTRPNFETNYNLNPEKIVVHGNAAIAYYFYSYESSWDEEEGTKKSKGSGKYAEFLIKENGKWKYLGIVNITEKEEKIK